MSILVSKNNPLELVNAPIPGNFLKKYSGELKKFKNVIFIPDVETTSRHPDEVEHINGSTAIGGRWASTIRKWVEAGYGTYNPEPRCRILTVGVSGLVFSWDMDYLTDDEKAELITDTLHGRVILGHNISFDLTWLYYTLDKASPGKWKEIQPRFILDSMLLARFHFEIMIEGLTKAVNKIPFSKRMKLFQDNIPRVSMEAVCYALKLPPPDKTFQKPANWTLSMLDDERYEYVSGDVRNPEIFLMKIAENYAKNKKPIPGPIFTDSLQAARYLYGEWPWLREYSGSLYVSARAGRRGVPFNTKHAEGLSANLKQEFDDSVNKIIKAPSFAGVEKDLRDTSKGESTKIKTALINYLAELGKAPEINPQTGKPSLSDDALALLGVSKDPICIAYMTRRHLQKNIDTVTQWIGYARSGSGRVHPALAPRANSLRESSESPNGQNLPTPPEYRAMVAAEDIGGEEYVIIATDYSAIELRIATALAIRAYREITKTIKTGNVPKSIKWLWDEFIRKHEQGDDIEVPEKPTGETVGFEAWKHYYSGLLAYLYREAEAMPMLNGFKRLGDLHLPTALSFVEGLDLKGMTPIDYLASMTKEERASLKEIYKKPRQRAKAVNFGNLYGAEDEGLWKYGIASYGLDWSIQEASASRASWFKTYPDAHLWQVWTRLTPIEKKVVYNTTKEEQEENGKIWKSTTLGGRPFLTTGYTNALNLQDQGTGADILARCKNTMPSDIEDKFILSVHDELLFHVPAKKAEVYRRKIEEHMISSADYYLRDFGVPVEVESSVGKVWIH